MRFAHGWPGAWRNLESEEGNGETSSRSSAEWSNAVDCSERVTIDTVSTVDLEAGKTIGDN